MSGFEHGVEGDEHVAHEGDDGDLGLPALVEEAAGEIVELSAGAACGQGGEVEEAPGPGAAALDMALALTGAAVAVGGTSALWRVAKNVATTIVATSIVLTLAMWLWPNGQDVLS